MRDWIYLAIGIAGLIGTFGILSYVIKLCAE
jgi:hypothetical protein